MPDANPKRKSTMTKASQQVSRLGPLYDFKQQECWSCMAIMRPIPMSICAILLGLLCILLGILFCVSATFAQESQTYRYDNLCDLNHKCTFRFELEEDLDAPVYLYYRIEGYYQAYRKYFDSRSFDQLRGVKTNNYDELGDCTPKISEDDEEDDPSAVFLPCGLIGVSYFNDTFLLLDDHGKKLDQASDDIGVIGDDSLYSDPGADTEGVRIVNSFDNPLLWVWMRAAALPNFNKLYAIIDEDMPKGMYKMEVKNHYPVREYKARKFFKLATTTWTGGRNFFLGFALLAAGLILFLFAFFVCLKTILWPRKLGNIAYLDWDNM